MRSKSPGSRFINEVLPSLHAVSNPPKLPISFVQAVWNLPNIPNGAKFLCEGEGKDHGETTGVSGKAHSSSAIILVPNTQMSKAIESEIEQEGNMATAAVETMQEQSNSNGMINNAAISHKGGQENEVGAGLGTDKNWPGWPGDNVFGLVVPVQKVGGIIGPKGEFVKKMCEETGSRIGRKGEFVKRPGHLSLEFYLLSAMMVDY